VSTFVITIYISHVGDIYSSKQILMYDLAVTYSIPHLLVICIDRGCSGIVIKYQFDQVSQKNNEHGFF